jgi:prepilin-type N-terminal cleavage/methylation domain-containing protein
VKIGGAILNRLTKPKGFTMIEMLVTLVILTVSLLALAALMAVTVRNNSFGGSMTEATTFGQDKLEELRAVRWETILDGTYNDQPHGSTGTSYTRRWDVVTSGNRKTVTVRVTWTDRVNHSVRLLSVVAQ